jgi:hypothetical protein
VGDERVSCDIHARIEYDDRAHFLAIFAAGDDHLLLAPGDGEMAIGVATPEIAGAIPAVGNRSTRRCLVFAIPGITRGPDTTISPIASSGSGAPSSPMTRAIRKRRDNGYGPVRIFTLSSFDSTVNKSLTLVSTPSRLDAGAIVGKLLEAP